jgi:DNA-directed RNA polymerase specialized sigma24 family protein
MATETFAQLVERAQQGDPAAVEQLLDTYGEAIRREVRFHLLDQRLRQVVGESDVFQSVALRFVLHLRARDVQFERPEDLVGLLKTMARARVAQLARFWQAQRRDVRKNAGMDNPDVQALPTDSLSVSSVIARRELLDRTLARLSARDRQIMQWRQDGLAWPDIAQRLEGPVRKRFANSTNER